MQDQGEWENDLVPALFEEQPLPQHNFLYRITVALFPTVVLRRQANHLLPIPNFVKQ